MRKKLLAATVGVAMAMAGGALATSPDMAPPAALMNRIAAPSAEVIGRFEAAGMRSVRPHVLTPAQQIQVEHALGSLPALHRRVLQKHLRRLSFVDGIPGQGTGLTSQVGQTRQFDITLRASVLNESLTTFLTDKERRLFAADASGQSVTIEAEGADALSYILLHEATHVLDIASDLTSRAGNGFGQGIWAVPKNEGRVPLAPQLAASPVAASRFRDAGPIPAGRARGFYDALAQSPFVSAYATAAPAEDLAELVAWHVISERHGNKMTIVVRDADGAVLARYEPMRFPAVRARIPLVDKLLREAERDGSS